ncbi:MAG: dienelactone hydrolase family protein [Rhodospirillaceae bacterium]
MNEEHVDIQTEDGVMPTFTCWPDGDGPYSAIVFYMDAPAIREELYDMARRMAAEGYYVILPDLFYRFGIIRFPLRNQWSRTVWQAIMKNLSNAMVMDDTRALLTHLDGHPAVKDGPKATVGFCMSGRIVTTAAATFPDIFAANASLYGVGIVTAHDDSPHLLVKDIKGEMYFGFAETDGTVPSFVIPTLKAALDEYGTDYVLDVHPGTEHGFCFPSRDVYVEAAAEKAYAHFMDMCARHLS